MQVIRMKQAYRVSYRTPILEKNHNYNAEKIEGGLKKAQWIVDKGFAVWLKKVVPGQSVKTALQDKARRLSAEEVVEKVEAKKEEEVTETQLNEAKPRTRRRKKVNG